MRQKKVQHPNEITFISLRIHPGCYAEQSTEPSLKYTLKELYLPFLFSSRLKLTITKPGQQNNAEH